MASNQAPPLDDATALDGEGFLRCGQYGGSPPVGGDAVMVCTEGVRGRYVYIYVPDNVLTLCEVQIFDEGKSYNRYIIRRL